MRPDVAEQRRGGEAGFFMLDGQAHAELVVLVGDVDLAGGHRDPDPFELCVGQGQLQVDFVIVEFHQHVARTDEVAVFHMDRSHGGRGGRRHGRQMDVDEGRRQIAATDIGPQGHNEGRRRQPQHDTGVARQAPGRRRSAMTGAAAADRGVAVAAEPPAA